MIPVPKGFNDKNNERKYINKNFQNNSVRLSEIIRSHFCRKHIVSFDFHFMIIKESNLKRKIDSIYDNKIIFYLINKTSKAVKIKNF